jgi:hypothetical protein
VSRKAMINAREVQVNNAQHTISLCETAY